MKMSHLLYFFSFFIANQLFARTFSTLRNGNFDDPSVWNLSQVPIFEEDTILIHHAIIYNRSYGTFGVPDCIKRPYIHISEMGHLCIDKNDTMFNIYLIQRGKFTARTIVKIGTEHFVYGPAYSNKTIISLGKFKSAIHVYRPGKYVVDTNKLSCLDSIKIDSSTAYDSKCPQASFFLRDSFLDSFRLKFWTYAVPYMNFKFQFPDTNIFVQTSDSFIYTMKNRKDFTIKISATDVCDRVYTYEMKYQFQESNSSIVRISKPNIQWQFIDDKKILVSSEVTAIFTVLIYDLTGRRLYECAARNEDEIDMTQSPSGTYYIQILGENKQIIQSARFLLP